MLLSCAIRWVYLSQLSHSVFGGILGVDENHYDSWGLSIARGRIIGKSVFYGLPLYPYLLGLIYKLFGHSIFLVRAFQSIVGMTSCALVYLLGKKVFSRKVGIISAFLFSFYGLVIFYEAQLLGVTLGIFLNLTALIMLADSFKTESKTRFLLTGIIVGLAALAVAGILMLVPAAVLGIFYFIKKRTTAAAAAILLIVGLLCPISLSTLHNYAAERDFVPVTSHAGISFYMGNNPDAKPYFTPIKEIRGPDTNSFIYGSREIAEADMGRRLKPSEISAYWLRKAKGYIIGNPTRYAKLAFRKFLYLINSAEVGDVYVDYGLIKKHIPILNIAAVSFFFIIPFAIFGIILKSKLDKNLYVILAYVISYSIAVCLFLVNSRYRLPLVPALIIFASYALSKLWDDLVIYKKSPLYPVMVLLPVFVITNLPLPHPAGINSHCLIGLAYENKGEVDKAIDIFREGLAISPGRCDLCGNLAEAYYKKGMLDRAETYSKKALGLKNDNPKAYSILGAIYADRGFLDKSIEALKIAVKLRPHEPDFHFKLGNYYMRADQPSLAVPEYEKAINLSAKPDYYNNLGKAYIKIGNKEKACAAWEEAIALDPDCQGAKDNLSKYKK